MNPALPKYRRLGSERKGGVKVVFLDRDGVINKYPGDKKYVTSWKEFRFLPRAKEAIAKLHKNKFKIFVISNQAGVSKGLYSQEALDILTKNMLKGIRKAGGDIERVYYCTHHQEQNCSCRKPKTGLLDLARKIHHVNLKGSFFIGDTIRDVHTARAAGSKAILVLCGREKLKNRKNWEAQPDLVFSNLYRAAEFILKSAN